MNESRKKRVCVCVDIFQGLRQIKTLHTNRNENGQHLLDVIYQNCLAIAEDMWPSLFPTFFGRNLDFSQSRIHFFAKFSRMIQLSPTCHHVSFLHGGLVYHMT